MKIARLMTDGAPFWAVVDPEQDLATPLKGAFETWAPDLARGDGAGHLDASSALALSKAKLRAPIEPAAKIVCVGMNYRSHLEVLGKEMPDRPVAYLKAQTAVIDPDAPLHRPPITNKLDYEIELVAVMARRIAPGEPPHAAILGYTIGNDVSGRDLSAGPRGLDLYSVKSLNGTAGVGPWITTVDEIPYPPDVRMQLRVNGETRQDDRTSSMHWGVDHLLNYANDRTWLLPADLVFTGTTSGVALESGRFLQPGDDMECEIEKIGLLRNRVFPPREGVFA
jgi:2-keto-4-pentenoate hydratase/2-oxohepta-3-ene-1,7-dioic acid hydratase in catechol pathway